MSPPRGSLSRVTSFRFCQNTISEKRRGLERRRGGWGLDERGEPIYARAYLLVGWRATLGDKGGGELDVDVGFGAEIDVAEG